MSAKLPATFYYDIISPFAYLYIKQRYRLEEKLDINPVPVLLGGLLRATENIGPAEVTEKRPHTYHFCIWQAEKLGIPFRLPDRHPFLSVAPQRLLLELNADWQMGLFVKFTVISYWLTAKSNFPQWNKILAR